MRFSTTSAPQGRDPADGDTFWAAEARQLAQGDLGSAKWIADLRQRVAQASDDDLGTFIVARAALARAGVERSAEVARQQAERVAELERQRQRAEEDERLARVLVRAEEARRRELARERRRRLRAANPVPVEDLVFLYGWGLVASVVYSFWVATALQGCWGDFSLTGDQECVATMAATWELGGPILLSCLAPMGLAVLLDLVAGRWMDVSWRVVFGIAGVLVGWAAYSSDPFLSPWIVGAGWILGQLVELVTGARARR